MKKIVLISLVVGYVCGWFVQGLFIDVEEQDNSIDTIVSVDGLEYEVDAVFEPIVDPEVPIPSLKRKVSGLTKATEETLAETVALLEEDHLDTSAWLTIGGLWKAGGNFEGAREAWEYVLALSPYNSVAPINLGNLYATDIKDFPKAEEWYRAAIDINSANIYAYTRLAELYLYQKKDRDGAVAIIDEGLVVAPSDEVLQSYREAILSGAM